MASDDPNNFAVEQHIPAKILDPLCTLESIQAALRWLRVKFQEEIHRRIPHSSPLGRRRNQKYPWKSSVADRNSSMLLLYIEKLLYGYFIQFDSVTQLN